MRPNVSPVYGEDDINKLYERHICELASKPMKLVKWPSQ